MASSSQLLSYHLYPSSCSGGKPIKLFKKGTFRSVSRHGSCSFGRIKASGSASGKRQVEIVYDPEERINRLADEVGKNTSLSRLSLFSPCKINVFLRITGKREDGFHDLASLFHVISLGDTIKFSLSPTKTRDRLSTNVPGVPLDESNLIIKHLTFTERRHALITSSGFILIKKSLQVLVLVVEVVMLQLLYGQPISLVAVLLLKRSFKNGRVKLVQMFPSFSLMEQHIVLVGVSGSTIVCVGSPDPPQFVYDDDDYKDVFVSEACFLNRQENEWYTQAGSSPLSSFSKEAVSTMEY